MIIIIIVILIAMIILKNLFCYLRMDSINSIILFYFVEVREYDIPTFI